MSEIDLIALIIPTCIENPNTKINITYFDDASGLSSDTPYSLDPHQTDIEIMRKEMKI